MEINERFLIGGLAAMSFALAALMAGGFYSLGGVLLVALATYLLWNGVQSRHTTPGSDQPA